MGAWVGARGSSCIGRLRCYRQASAQAIGKGGRGAGWSHARAGLSPRRRGGSAVGASAQAAPGAPIHIPLAATETVEEATMLHRLLDVIFQYLALLVGVLIVVPVAVLGAGIALDRTQVVTARMWADHPAVLADSPFTHQADGLTPAQHQSTLLNALLLTDSFVSAAIQHAP